MHRWKLVLLFLCVACPTLAQTFVQRDGTRLTYNGKPFRFGGANVEWLGLEGYGPHDPLGPRYPSKVEIDDALLTVQEMGGTVIRSQTMGDTVGCSRCIEPSQGTFNEDAFQASDYTLAQAAKLHLKLIVSLIGDCATCSGGGIGQYLAWNGKSSFQDFFTDPSMLAAYERHVDAVLNHRNRITGVLYRDDPTILAWENCNMCGIFAMLSGGNLDQVAAWSETVGKHIKGIDGHHLYLDTTGIFRNDPKGLTDSSVDIATFEEYPHWDSILGGGQHTTAQTFQSDAATVTGHGKVFIVNEFGWDKTDWKTPDDLQSLLDTMLKDQNISGDLFWALQAHNENFGFQPIPADTSDQTFAEHGESGEWWALYYPGRKTLVMTAEDMAGRAQQLRSHAYRMAGLAVPPHAAPATPVITSVVLGGLVAWRGVVGATRYSIERQDAPGRPWQVVCDHCVSDEAAPWADPHPASLAAHYRVTAYNADNVASAASAPR